MEPLYAFIGGGNMGRALIGGLVAAPEARPRIRVSEPVEASRKACAAIAGVEVAPDNRSAAMGADVVVLAVKPQQMRAAVAELLPATRPYPLYLSIAAGITLEHLGTWLGPASAIVRCMPNTPAQIGFGASAMCANEHVNAVQRALSTRLLSAVGVALWLEDERLLDAVTALSGSGPAYVFLLLELLEQAGTRLGLPAALARRLALETVHGSARLARESAEEPAALRRQVTSPGGTTERALEVFAQADLAGIVARALIAARDRSIELAQQVAT